MTQLLENGSLWEKNEDGSWGNCVELHRDKIPVSCVGCWHVASDCSWFVVLQRNRCDQVIFQLLLVGTFYDRFLSRYVVGTFWRIRWPALVQLLWWYFFAYLGSVCLLRMGGRAGRKGSFKFLLLSGFFFHVVPNSVLLFQMCETECLVFRLLLFNALSWCWIVEILKDVVKTLVLSSDHVNVWWLVNENLYVLVVT